jgi:outer membrane protein assembly factor BamB
MNIACWPRILVIAVIGLTISEALPAVLWSTSTGGAVDSSPTVVNGVVYVGSDSGSIYALNATTGQIVWQTNTGAPVNSSPTVVNGVVYVGSESGYLYALNATTGQIVWQTNTGAAGSSPSLAVNSVVGRALHN